MVKKKKILLLSKYPRMGASSRLRSLQYIPYLEANGFEITVQSLFNEAHLNGIYTGSARSLLRTIALYSKRLLSLFNSHRYDLIWIEKEIFPYIPAFAERILSWIGKPYIVDYDDAIFHNYDLSNNSVVRKILGKNIDVIMRLSRYVIAGNEYIKARAEAAGAKSVALIPTTVDYTRYTPKAYTLNPTLVIGWIGTPFTQKYVVAIREALIKVCHTYNARLMLIGADSKISKELPGIDLQVLPWAESSEASLIQQMDIGIMPLPDGPWEKGKCGYKLIQYMASAVPIITSPVGVNVEIVNNHQCGFLASTLEEWETNLSQLITSPERRQRLGMAGRKAVEDKYSLQVQHSVLAKVLNEAID